MIKSLCAIVAILTLSTFATPSHAATVIIQIGSYTENVNLDFGNGYTSTGGAGFTEVVFTDFINPPSSPSFFGGGVASLEYGGTPLSRTFCQNCGLGNISGDPEYFAPPSNPNNFGCPPGCEAVGWSVGHLPTSFADFTLNGIPAVSGDVTITSHTEVSSTPLPTSLPLFGSGLLFLAGFIWRRKVSSAALI